MDTNAKYLINFAMVSFPFFYLQPTRSPAFSGIGAGIENDLDTIIFNILFKFHRAETLLLYAPEEDKIKWFQNPKTIILAAPGLFHKSWNRFVISGLNPVRIEAAADSVAAWSTQLPHK